MRAFLGRGIFSEISGLFLETCGAAAIAAPLIITSANASQPGTETDMAKTLPSIRKHAITPNAVLRMRGIAANDSHSVTGMEVLNSASPARYRAGMPFANSMRHAETGRHMSATDFVPNASAKKPPAA